MKFTPSSLGLALLACFLLLLAAPRADAQVVIYRLEFSKVGPSVNYGFYHEAWVVAEATGGTASWVLVYQEGPHQKFVRVDAYGSYFQASHRGQVQGVIYATPGTNTPTSTFLALGEASSKVKSLVATVKVPKKLEGYTISGDSESELPFTVNEIDKGYAGSSKIKGELQSRMSSDANEDDLTVSETMDSVVASLKRKGYQDATPTTTTTTTTN
ncbi:MAG TPA: hypothetical protein P5016_14565 [Verrucomicrobiales bacterium]|nr:hypothetical protein [Verrucomicrobiae bacterium]MCP5553168.1 hypothetical protein [Akkermansiaceae bacterium]HRX55736.1 hypothetical protein [Verrucomicrobiales bacterium]